MTQRQTACLALTLRFTVYHEVQLNPPAGFGPPLKTNRPADSG